MKNKIVYPKKIAKFNNVENPKSLLEVKPLQIGLLELSTMKVNGKGFVVLDFGKEMCGSVRILTGGIEGGGTPKIRIRFGESISECYSNIGEKGSTNDHSPRDIEALLTSWSDLTFGASGYRFIRIDFLEDKVMYIKSILGTNNMLSLSPIYRYKGEDKLINDIFLTAKRTVDLCGGGDYLWDGVKRDRLVWIGDIYPEMLSLSTLYGRTKVLENSLDFAREQTPLPNFMNGFPTYSMWWIIIIADYYKFTSCRDFAKRQLDYLVELLKIMDKYINEDGTTSYPFYFVDWPTHETEDEIVGSNIINVLAMKKAIELLSSFNLDTSLADKMLNKLLKGNFKVKDKKQVIALKYFAFDKISDEEYKTLIKGGAQGFSTFMSYFMLSAVASKDKALAINIMKEYYGAMLEKKATTFWEDFDINWTKDSSRIDKLPKRNEKDIHGDFGAFCYLGFRHSLCHGWSSGVIKFIEENC